MLRVLCERGLRIFHCYCFQTSRQTISRIADYAEQTQHENNKELQKLKAELLNERQYGMMAEQKLKQVHNASLRHTEELARELDLLKSSSLLSNESS